VRTKITQAAKWIWIAILLAGVVFYLSKNWDSLGDLLRGVSAPRLVLSSLCLTAAKLILVELSRLSVDVTGSSIGYRRMFYINSMSQLAKYLPGGVWHFVGRAGFYHQDGLALKTTTRAMVTENLWLVSSAFVVGAGFCASYYVGASGALVVGMILILHVAILFLANAPSYRTWRVLLKTMVVQWTAWFLIGLAFWLIIPELDSVKGAALAIGGFCISWAIGYLAIFAPGGVGVREGVLVGILSATLTGDRSLVLAAMNRLVWILAELALGAAARLWATPESPAQPAFVTPPEGQGE
jgi:uncharacterized membrane protein YbhN (UPF0104 family)